MPLGPFSVHWAGDKAPHTEGKATVDLEVGQLTVFVSHRTQHWPLSPALVLTLPV